MPVAEAIRPQFGSRPWTAAFTRLLDTTLRAVARASASSTAPETWQTRSGGGPLAVGGLLPREAACDRLHGRLQSGLLRGACCGRGRVGSAGREEETVSFVLVSPSTVSWSRRPGGDAPEDRAEHAWIGRRVGEDDREHRRHPGMDHPDALCDPAHRHRHVATRRVRQIQARRRPFRVRIRGHERTGGALEPGRVRRQAWRERRHAGGDDADGQAGPDEPRGHREDPGRSGPERASHRSADGLLVDIARGPRGGVRGARCGDDRPRQPVPSVAGRHRRLEVRARAADRRGRERVCGEHRRRGSGPPGRRDKREVRPAGPLDPAATRPPRTLAGQHGDALDVETAPADSPRLAGSRPASRTPGGLRRPGGDLFGSRHGRAGVARARPSPEPEQDVERLHALAGGALHEVVDHADREDTAGALVEPHVDAARVAPEDVLGSLWCGHHLLNQACRRRPPRRAHRGRLRRPGSRGRAQAAGHRVSSGPGAGRKSTPRAPGLHRPVAERAQGAVDRYLLHLRHVPVAADAVRLSSPSCSPRRTSAPPSARGRPPRRLRRPRRRRR